MKDIYLDMNSQNILKFYGTRLDSKLDSSEFYDYEVSKVTDDYNTDVLDLSTTITYTTLKINQSLAGFSCSRNTISLVEYNNTINDANYKYSGLTLTAPYSSFVNHISPTHEHTILNSYVYKYTGFTGETHYFTISAFNLPLSRDHRFPGTTEADAISGFTTGSTSTIKCALRLADDDGCCAIPNKLSNKPWAYQFKEPFLDCPEYIERRPASGWTLDFIFNRDSLPWSSGGVFYYFGTRGSNTPSEYADSNLSFKFTSDGRIRWTAVRYSGYCTGNTYTETYYTETGQTPTLCTTGVTKDFNVTIVFDRYKHYDGCDIENMGGWNDMLGTVISTYTDNSVSAVTSTQLTTYEETYESLKKKWADERQRRLGVLKIYLNGRPIYKKENFEEVIPSNRGNQPFIQSWGGGTGLMNNVHNGVSCFNIKSIKYYEEPLDFVHVRHNFITRLSAYDFFICGIDCDDDLISYVTDGLLAENGEYIITEDNNMTLY